MADSVALAGIAALSSFLGAGVGAASSYFAVARTQRTELEKAQIGSQNEIEKLRVDYDLERKRKGQDFAWGKRMAYKEFTNKAELTPVDDPATFSDSDDGKKLIELYNIFLFSAPPNVRDLADAYRATWTTRPGRQVGDPEKLRLLREAMLQDLEH